jgi:hypothetical protein
MKHAEWPKKFIKTISHASKHLQSYVQDVHSNTYGISLHVKCLLLYDLNEDCNLFANFSKPTQYHLD